MPTPTTTQAAKYVAMSRTWASANRPSETITVPTDMTMRPPKVPCCRAGSVSSA